MNCVLCGSNNKKKLRELTSILGGLSDISVCTPADLGISLDIAETGSSFRENAILKAEAFMQASAMVAVADDSGLVVDALGGAPGIYSARYAGEEATDDDRNALVLGKLNGIPASQRTARFVCAIAVARPGGPTDVVEAAVEGLVAMSPRGDNGFGYDPIFFYPPFGCTFGEVDAQAKGAVSHRGQALRLARSLLIAQ